MCNVPGDLEITHPRDNFSARANSSPAVASRALHHPVMLPDMLQSKFISPAQTDQEDSWIT